MSELKITRTGDKVTAEKNGLTLDGTEIAQAITKLHRYYGTTVAARMGQLVSEYMRTAVAVCDAAQLAGNKIPRAERAKVALDYLRAIADGGEQLFTQVNAKSN